MAIVIGDAEIIIGKIMLTIQCVWFLLVFVLKIFKVFLI